MYNIKPDSIVCRNATTEMLTPLCHMFVSNELELYKSSALNLLLHIVPHPQ